MVTSDFLAAHYIIVKIRCVAICDWVAERSVEDFNLKLYTEVHILESVVIKYWYEQYRRKSKDFQAI